MSDPAVAPDPAAAALKAKRAANLAKARAAKRAAPPAPVEPEPVETLGAPAYVDCEEPIEFSRDPDGEMAFIDAALTRTLAEGGDKVKYLYQNVVAAVQARRVIREVMAEIEPGGKFPQWVTLGRNDSTGEFKPVDVSAARAKVLAAADAPFRPVATTPAPPPDLLAQLAALLAQNAAQNAAPSAPAAQGRPATARSPSTADILQHVTGGRPSVPVGDGPRHGVELT